MTTDYTDPSTIDVDVVMGNINHAHRMRGHPWTDERSWPNVTVKALADEIDRLRALVGGRSAAPTRDRFDKLIAIEAELYHARQVIRRLLAGHEITQTVRGPEWWGGEPGSDTPAPVTEDQQAVIAAVESGVALLSRSAPTREQVASETWQWVGSFVADLAAVDDIEVSDVMALAFSEKLADHIVALLSRSAAEPPTEPQPDTVAYNVAVLAAPACPLCRDTGKVPATGQGCDGFDPCPDCVGVAAEPNKEAGDGR